MSAVTREAVEARLRQFTDPHLNQDPVSAGCLREVDIQGGKVAVRLELGYAATVQAYQACIDAGFAGNR